MRPRPFGQIVAVAAAATAAGMFVTVASSATLWADLKVRPYGGNVRSHAAAAASTAPPAAASSVATPALAADAPACTDGTLVRTVEGPVCGTTANGVTSYLGIRFAAPPVGALRWKAPQPVTPWTDTFQATRMGNWCPQPPRAGTQALSEDCLNLNVQVPAERGSSLPVMVEIHGGGFLLFGPPDATHLVRTGNVIVVAMNYRVGIMGFLSHAALGANSGNYGLQDQQAALRWVQRNITRFGGDPGNVTIFGQSAGGASVCAHTASPGSAGLFQRGISESGFYNVANGNNNVWEAADCKSRLRSLAEAEQAGARFAVKVGCASASGAAECLRALPAETLVEQASQTLRPNTGGTIAPTVDGVTLPMSPSEAFATGNVNDVSLMIGADRDEMNGGVNAAAAIATTPEEYRMLVTQRFGPFAPKVFEQYPLERFPGSSPFIAYRTIVADSDSVCPALGTFDTLSKHLQVYAWEGDNAAAPRPDSPYPLGAFHDTENRFNFPRADAAPLDANQRAFQQQINAQWTGYARTGSPQVPGTPLWTPYSARNPLVMSLVPGGDSVLTPASTIASQHHCAFWNGAAARRNP